MSYSLNSLKLLKRGYIGDYIIVSRTTIRLIKGDIRSVDYGSYRQPYTQAWQDGWQAELC